MFPSAGDLKICTVRYCTLAGTTRTSPIAATTKCVKVITGFTCGTKAKVQLTFTEGTGGPKSKSTAVSPSPTRKGKRGTVLRAAEGWRPSRHIC
jgi:hypothetical protein